VQSFIGANVSHAVLVVNVCYEMLNERRQTRYVFCNLHLMDSLRAIVVND